MMRVWMKICMACIIRVGHSRAPLHLAQQLHLEPAPAQRQCEDIRRDDRILNSEIDAHAAHGDMAWAASPIHSTPGLYQRFSRSTRTVSSFTSSQEDSSCTRSASDGLSSTIASRKADSPWRRSSLIPPLRNDEGALPVVAAVEHDEHAGRPRCGQGFPFRPRPLATGASTARPSARRDPRRRGRHGRRTAEWRPSAPTTWSART